MEYFLCTEFRDAMALYNYISTFIWTKILNGCMYGWHWMGICSLKWKDYIETVIQLILKENL